MIYNICQELCKDVDYNQNMNIKEEIKVIIARRGTTLKKVCEILSEKTSKYYSYNNISNKLRSSLYTKKRNGQFVGAYAPTDI